jgi:hypothetical protein
VLKYIKKFLPPPQWRILLTGLLLIVGVVGEQSQSVFSNQLAKLYISAPKQFEYQANTTHAQQQSNSTLQSQAKVLQLRRALARSSSKAAPVQVWEDRTTLVPTTTAQKSVLKTSPQPAQTQQQQKFPQQDGVYLYGQSPKPGQFGYGYIIFEKHQRQVTGALYVPRSEYSCFQGTLEPLGKLAVTVKGYPGEGSLLQVATKDRFPSTSDSEPVIYGHSLALSDYYRLSSVSASDRQILQACQADWQK